MLTLGKCKLYLRVDVDFEDSLIEQCMRTAESYMIGAVTDYKINYAIDEDYAEKADHCKLAIISDLFNNRDPRADGRNDFSYAIRSMINQLNLYVPEVSNGERNSDSLCVVRNGNND